MAREISKPQRRNDSKVEYLPTQFIAEFIKGEKYDGVGYRSTISDKGINIALFDEGLVECIDVNTVEISSIEYKISK
ncbi:RES family NAD+ phosphorylase [Selenomonas ruminantium]|uniref:RES family NAD+ phosphorylase n=1 Tax=Selenomonas ruminantium TaxID=971 RepID=UPI000945884D